MAFEVFWTETVKQDLNALPRELVIRIIRKVEIAKENPYHFLTKLIGRREWKLRVGDYRIFCEIGYEKNQLKVMHAEHRSRAYERD